MRKTTWLVLSLAALAFCGAAVAQDGGVQAVIGNVFLQNTTPGTAQIGHATIGGTFRAGQVFVQQASAVTIPIVGNSLTTGAGSTVGGSFSAAQQSSIAVRGTATSLVGSAVGVRGFSRSANGEGVQGECASGTGVEGITETGVAVVGSGNSGVGILGVTSSGIGVASNAQSGFAVSGQNSSPGNAAVRGLNNATTAFAIGGEFHSNSADGLGVLAVCNKNTAGGVGVYGKCLSATGFGVFSEGRTGATGTKSFVIDHPLDPENRYLTHFSHEGPEPMNVYSGSVRSDARGYATVRLPAYYATINRDARVQLTVVDEADTASFVQAKVVRKVNGNEFTLRTSAPRVEVYWRVEAVRNDRWVQKNGHDVEPVKPQQYRGTYLQPELYGKPESMSQVKGSASSRSTSAP